MDFLILKPGRCRFPHVEGDLIPWTIQRREIPLPLTQRPTTMFSVSLLVAGLASAVFVNSQTIPANCTRTYTVQSGDFCDKISATQNVSTYQLATVNSGIINTECSNLFVGEVLCLGLDGQDCTQVAVVTAGSDCNTIATAAGICFADLLQNNPNIDAQCTNIYGGEVLCVAPVTN
ncbi:unnamed protein product [Cyclocybe aegerita]|uniref:LysM domain-containing protein n=1 Tax=Cyclocybe aegerita TaxID=1973307 RepID=A0A8S0X7E3_CYCAE|nr:unnamed protein product [Cyclocybe aegerita]